MHFPCFYLEKNGGKRGGGRIVGTVCRLLLSCIFMDRETIFMIGVSFYIFSLEHFEPCTRSCNSCSYGLQKHHLPDAWF